MELSKYIGKRIKEFRKAHNLTTEELAEKIGTTRATVTRYGGGGRGAGGRGRPTRLLPDA